MSEKQRITSAQGDRLAREVPGTLIPDGERLLPKLAVALFLGLGLAVVGTATDEGTKHAAVERLEPLGAGQPPAIVVDRNLAAGERRSD